VRSRPDRLRFNERSLFSRIQQPGNFLGSQRSPFVAGIAIHSRTSTRQASQQIDLQLLMRSSHRLNERSEVTYSSQVRGPLICLIRYWSIFTGSKSDSVRMPVPSMTRLIRRCNWTV